MTMQVLINGEIDLTNDSLTRLANQINKLEKEGYESACISYNERKCITIVAHKGFYMKKFVEKGCKDDDGDN